MQVDSSQKKKRARNSDVIDIKSPAPVEAEEDSNETSLTLLVAKALSGEPQGVLALALSPDEQYLAVARTTGSVQLYRVVLVNGVFHLTLLAHTGGKSNMTITGLQWSEDASVLLIGLLSGQIVVLSATTLAPISIQHRAGGAVRAMCRAGSHFIVANADGMWRQYSLHANGRLELEQTAHKIGDATRALSVDASTKLQLAVGSDDSGNVVAWKLKFSEIRDYSQQWVCKLPSGYANCVAIVDQTNSVAAGTSVGSVVIIDATVRLIVHTFSHHRGPVTCLTTHSGVLYASGAHESLRSYRHDGSKWFPAEVKRRTHYHEATALAIGGDSGLFLSASRDGTIMYTNRSKLFTHPASYLDCSGQQFCYANNIIAHNSGKAIEAYVCNEAGNLWLPLFRYQTKTKQHIKGIACNETFTLISITTDTKVTVVRINRVGELGVELEAVTSLDLPCVGDVHLVGEEHAYIAGPESIIYVDLKLRVNSTVQLSFTPLKLALSPSTNELVAYGAHVKQHLRVSPETGVPEVVNAQHPVEVFELLNVAEVEGAVMAQQLSNGVFRGDSSFDVAPSSSFKCGAPADAKLIGATGKYFFASFNPGLLAATRGVKAWHMIKRCVVKAAFQKSPTELLVLERNLEETLERLPPTWRVRRFGN